MWILQVAQGVWDMMNGRKFNSGVAITLLALVMQNVLGKYGLNHDTAVSGATYLVGAGGFIVLLVGYVHQWIKANAAKKAAAVGKVTGTADNTISGGTIVPILLLGLLLFGAVQTQAKETFNQPFAYLSMKTPPSTMGATDGLWVIKPAPSFSLVGIARGEGGVYIASPFSGAGLGVSIERLISINGNFFTSLSLSFNGLFSPIPETKDYKFSGSAIIGTTIYPIGILGVGPGTDGKKASFVIAYEGSFGF
jgi:hypothetical protein